VLNHFNLGCKVLNCTKGQRSFTWCRLLNDYVVLQKMYTIKGDPQLQMKVTHCKWWKNSSSEDGTKVKHLYRITLYGSVLRMARTIIHKSPTRSPTLPYLVNQDLASTKRCYGLTRPRRFAEVFGLGGKWHCRELPEADKKCIGADFQSLAQAPLQWCCCRGLVTVQLKMLLRAQHTCTKLGFVNSESQPFFTELGYVTAVWLGT
jgi:hypothetical protein